MIDYLTPNLKFTHMPKNQKSRPSDTKTTNNTHYFQILLEIDLEVKGQGQRSRLMIHWKRI